MDQLHADQLTRTSAGTRAAARDAAALLLLALAVALGAVGCRTAASAPRPLANAEGSPDALARRFLGCLEAGDVEAMKGLRVSKEEFCTYVFPELPSSKLNNVTCDFVWSQATLNSMAGMTKMLDKSRGKHYDLVSVRFAATESHDSYRVLKSPTVTVRDETGATEELRLFGSMLELDGQYKLFSFVVD